MWGWGGGCCQTETKFLGIHPNAASRNTKAIHCDFDFTRDDDDDDIEYGAGVRAPHTDVYRHYDATEKKLYLPNMEKYGDALAHWPIGIMATGPNTFT